MAKDRLVNFAGLIEQLVPLQGRAACWFDFKLRNYTNFKCELKFAADPYAHTGMAYVKVVSDEETALPHFEYVDDLFIIRDRDSQLMSEDGWFVHVLQLDVDFVRRRFDGLKGLERLIDGATDPNQDIDEIDEAGKIEQEYRRVGIDRSVGKTGTNDESKLPKSSMIVLWEYHYLSVDKKGGKTRRIRTVSPDNPTFDFEDDREYPDGYKGWMIKEGRREFKTKRAYDPRGLTEILAEPQAFLSALVRTIHNKMTWSQNPLVSAPDGLPEGSTQNFTLEPGTLLPFLVQFPQPPGVEGEWFEQIQFMREYGEQRGRGPDFGLAKDAEGQGKDPRTLGELQMIQESNQTNASSVLDNWDDFITEILKEAWNLIVANKDKFKDFAYVSGQGLEQMDVEALSDQYMITVTSSAEILNKKLRLDKLINIHQMGIGKPYYNEAAGFRKIIERMEPNFTEELFIEGPQEAATEAQKALLDLNQIAQTGGNPQIEEGQDHAVRARTTAQYLSNPRNTKGLPVPIVGGLVAYGKAQAQMMGQRDPKGAQNAMALFAGIQQSLEQMPQPGGNGQQAGPPQAGAEPPKTSITITFKDLPMAGKIQEAAKIGIKLTPQDFMDQAKLDAMVNQQEKKTEVEADVAKKTVDQKMAMEGKAADHALGMREKSVDHQMGMQGKMMDHAHAGQMAEKTAELRPEPKLGAKK